MEYEADAWFTRNKSVIENYSANKDRVVSLLKYYDLHIDSILEIGCSAGYRLNGIIETIGKDIKVFGIDPSNTAIEFGKKTIHQ
ncbi:MAG: hypothetical protein JSR09_08925 [Bacteroidetes bacterium]|nr:hypothetical protein [Bacteroidota bacterium]MBS1627775.1 hypothetical protein [Bacteroidota bacterium]MBS1649816.1 hypothetical protein [Bacteroidota bacterium]